MLKSVIETRPYNVPWCFVLKNATWCHNTSIGLHLTEVKVQQENRTG